MRISDWSSDVCSSDLGPQPLFHARIERVAQAVAEDVDGEDGGSEEGAGAQDDPRRALKHVAAVGDDVAPGRDFARQTGAAETEDRLGQDRRGADLGDRQSVVWGTGGSIQLDIGGGAT